MYDDNYTIGIERGNCQDVCKNLLKFNKGKYATYITLDVERSGLGMTYETICYVMEKFYHKLMFFYDCIDERKFKKVELSGHMIICHFR